MTEFSDCWDDWAPNILFEEKIAPEQKEFEMKMHRVVFYIGAFTALCLIKQGKADLEPLIEETSRVAIENAVREH